jgi:hypothetical protein
LYQLNRDETFRVLRPLNDDILNLDLKFLMTLNQALQFIFNEFSVGNFTQNIGFYTLLSLIIWIVVFQFQHKSRKFRVD